MNMQNILYKYNTNIRTMQSNDYQGPAQQITNIETDKGYLMIKCMAGQCMLSLAIR